MKTIHNSRPSAFKSPTGSGHNWKRERTRRRKRRDHTPLFLVLQCFLSVTSLCSSSLLTSSTYLIPSVSLSSAEQWPSKPFALTERTGRWRMGRRLPGSRCRCLAGVLSAPSASLSASLSGGGSKQCGDKRLDNSWLGNSLVCCMPPVSLSERGETHTYTHTHTHTHTSGGLMCISGWGRDRRAVGKNAATFLLLASVHVI